MKKTWYYKEGSKKAELWTLLHLPYTFMCISFFIVGCGILEPDWSVVLGGTIAYFFGLQAAPFIDQLPSVKGSKYVKLLTARELKLSAGMSLAIAVAIGIYFTISWKAWHMLWLIPLQAFFVGAYPTSKPLKIFHSDSSFAISFGALPCLVGHYASTLAFSPVVIPFLSLSFLIALQEITLSRYVREARKKGVKYEYYKKPEVALKILCSISYSLAIAVILV